MSRVNKNELSPDTATGVGRLEPDVPSPSCADQKASQPHHKPTKPTPLPPSPRPSPNALAPARRRSTPNTISHQAIPQSHTCEHANARVSSKHSNAPSTQKQDPHLTSHSIPQTLHTALTPQHHSNASHTPHRTARTPYALLNIQTNPSTGNARKIWHKHNTNTRSQNHPRHAHT